MNSSQNIDLEASFNDISEKNISLEQNIFALSAKVLELSVRSQKLQSELEVIKSQSDVIEENETELSELPEEDIETPLNDGLDQEDILETFTSFMKSQIDEQSLELPEEGQVDEALSRAKAIWADEALRSVLKEGLEDAIKGDKSTVDEIEDFFD